MPDLLLVKSLSQHLQPGISGRSNPIVNELKGQLSKDDQANYDNELIQNSILKILKVIF